MPRRRKITIRASELECFETLVRELQQRPEFAGFDPSSLHVWAYERYEPKLKDADAILRRFDYWLGVHKSERYLMANGSRLFNKKELAEALGVARPTLDRWITNGWLEPCRVQISAGGDTLFAANAVREVLERFRYAQKPHHQRGRYPPPSFFCPEQNPITRQCQPKQTNAKVRKRAAECLRCGTGWHRLALICNVIRRFREGFGKPFFASSTKFESL